jgi:hypothetical protein
VLVNRAAAHLRLGRAAECVADAERAVALLRRGGNQRSLALAHARRAAGLACVGQLAAAAGDMATAARVLGDDATLRADAAALAAAAGLPAPVF